MLSSTDTKKDAETGCFIADNDSVKFTYSFSGRNAPVNIDVYNKLNEPLYIDWQRSALITNNAALSYANSNIKVTGDITGASVGNNTVRISSGSIDATAALPSSILFIPPHAHASKTLLEVNGQYIADGFKDKFVEKEVPSLGIVGTSTVKVAEFTKEQSPLIFKSYLTLYIFKNNLPQYISYQNSFFVSKIISITELPENFDTAVKRGDLFYIQKSSAYAYPASGVTGSPLEQ